MTERTKSTTPSLRANLTVDLIVGLSDIHLGAFNSTLSFFVDTDDALLRQTFEGPSPNFKGVSSTTAWHVFETIRESIEREARELAEDDDIGKRTLVLHGDLLDLSLAPMALCCLNARCFFHWAKNVAKFNRIVYVPGNHDHHVWRMFMESDFLPDSVQKGNSSYPRTTNASRPAPTIARLLGVSLPFHMVYPHYQHLITVDGKEWSLVFHHGHFLERWWTALSSLMEAPSLGGHSLEQLEALNEPLTELLWFSIGDAGRLSQLVNKLYVGASDPRLMTSQIKIILDEATEQLKRRWNFKLPWWVPERAMKWTLSRLVAGMSVNRERPARIDLTAASLRNSKLEGDLLQAALKYRSRYAPLARSVFVFGHTHKTQATAEDLIDLEAEELVSNQDSFDQRILNTGGWVVEPHISDPPDASYFISVGAKMKLAAVTIPTAAVQAARAASGLCAL